LYFRFCHFDLAGAAKIQVFAHSEARLLPRQNYFALQAEDILQHLHREIAARLASGS
jgi:hypothetical protein